jgi:DNA-binding transcriptional regulator YdaS (Cro superfamily)
MDDENKGASPIERAVTAAGGRSEFARRMGVSVVMVHKWLTGRARLTGERARQIEHVVGGVVKRHELRPDLFDPPAESAA